MTCRGTRKKFHFARSFVNFLESENRLINPAKTTSAIDRPMDGLRGSKFALRQFALSDGAPLPAVPLARGRGQAGDCLSRIFFRTLGGSLGRVHCRVPAAVPRGFIRNFATVG